MRELGSATIRPKSAMLIEWSVSTRVFGLRALNAFFRSSASATETSASARCSICFAERKTRKPASLSFWSVVSSFFLRLGSVSLNPISTRPISASSAALWASWGARSTIAALTSSTTSLVRIPRFPSGARFSKSSRVARLMACEEMRIRRTPPKVAVLGAPVSSRLGFEGGRVCRT